MYSPYERVKDRRSFVERKDVYSGPIVAPPTEIIKPKEGDAVKNHDGGEKPAEPTQNSTA